MNKRTIIYICCAIAVVLIIAFAIYFVVSANKSENTQEKITITKYNENFKVDKTIDITNKKQVKELTKICNNPSLEQDDMTPYLAIKNDVKLDFNNGIFFMIQLNLEEYCYYEDSNSDTKLVIKMPEGLLESINNILAENP